MSSQIIVIKPKSMSSADRAKLTKAGNIVVEHTNPGEVVYRQQEEHLPYVYTNCCVCGDRIYVLKERMSALKSKKKTFYCSQGHGQSFN